MVSLKSSSCWLGQIANNETMANNGFQPFFAPDASSTLVGQNNVSQQFAPPVRPNAPTNIEHVSSSKKLEKVKRPMNSFMVR